MSTAKCIGKARVRGKARWIPHLAKNERDVGHPALATEPEGAFRSLFSWCMLVRIQDSVVKVVVFLFDRTRFGGPGLARAPRSLEINQ